MLNRLILLLFLVGCPQLWAQGLLIERILYLEDPDQGFRPEAALLDMERHGAVFQGIASQYSDSYHWFRIDLRALPQDGPGDILHAANSLISEFAAWRIDGHQLIEIDSDRIPHRYPVLTFKAEAGERFSILVKIFLPDVTGLEFSTEPPALTAFEGPFNSFTFGFILAGFAAGLLVYNFLLYLFLRDSDLANFSLYAFCLIVGTFGATGGFTVLGWPASINRWMPCVAAFGVACGLNFTRSFLDTKKTAPVFDKLFLTVEFCNILCCLLLGFGLSRKVQYIIDGSMAVGLTLAMTFAVVAFRRGQALAGNYLLGWLGFVVAYVPFIGVQYELIQRNMLTENAQMFALDLQILILSSAISTKISRIRVELLARLQEANNALERKVDERTRTVIEQQQTMIQTAKMASLGEMAGGIAHEINNPLMIINGYAENLSLMISRDQLTAEKAAAFQQRIQNATDRIRNIVNGLRTLSRETSADESQDTTLQDLVKDALSLCESRFTHRGIELRVVLPTRDVRLRCNSGQICQILINLLNNAFDAVEHLPQPWVEIRAEEMPDKVSLRLMDCGPGIPAEVADRIFDPFFTTKEIGKGTGLGLSISKSLIERQGGRIFIDPNAPHTCFVVELHAA